MKTRVLRPPLWDDKNFGTLNPNNPIVGVSWYEANAYCRWLLQHWKDLLESNVNAHITPSIIRLPLETEWVTAAGGEVPKGRYPWDDPQIVTASIKDILHRANIEESAIEHTTPVNTYPYGKSPYGVMDMAGNVWEWQANYYGREHPKMAVRGGSWDDNYKSARVASRYPAPPNYSFYYDIGFRVVIIVGP